MIVYGPAPGIGIIFRVINRYRIEIYKNISIAGLVILCSEISFEKQYAIVL